MLNAAVLENFVTEGRNAASADIDSCSALEIVTIINNEDKKVPAAVEKALPEIAALVDEAASAFRRGGRLVYLGAGTSGRLGVLDASECPPTYGVDPGMVVGLIAGGEKALTHSVESVEDDAELGVSQLKEINFNARDVLVGITASGQALYVLGALKYAAGLGAVTAAISCNKNAKVFECARHRLCAEAGPEVVAGSTRMKAGTAQKLILNMISTGAMIRIGKVYKNLMVDMTPVNQKLVLRSIRIIGEAAGCPLAEAEKAFIASGKKTKTAIVMLLTGTDRERAEALLRESGGRIGGIQGII
ncbi:MAG: N-acetylmuramic acid 6-phosphate etherase [Treponema sp.]|jgi:N-acetylmuramic acid 6-phosphate etherase|nr:N-acetylmuramic acid 6-phosphate etherase [Treponema sp.]